MSDILSYISTKVANGKEFDTLVGNLLAYKPETWGCIEQDYNSIGTDFSVDSNSLYNLPVGNYKLTNLPDSPFDTDFVNLSVYLQNTTKIITCDIGGNEKYFTEISDSTASVIWSDMKESEDANITFMSVSDTAPENTSMIWIDTSKIATSDYDWREVSSANASLQSVCYGNGIFVAIPLTNGTTDKFIYSRDGEEWIEISVGTAPRIWRSLCYGIDRFVAVSWDNIFAYSTDGITWVEVSVNSSRSWESICFGNGRYVAIAYNSNVFAYSVNGLVWAEVNIGTTVQNWVSVCYGKGRFVAVSSNNNVFAYSTDAIIWTLSNVSMVDRRWNSICFGNDKFIIVGNDSFVAYSTDGIVWIELVVSTSYRKIISVCYGNDEYVAAVYGSNIFLSSEDGILWKENKITNNSREWTSITYGNGRYVVVSNDGIIAFDIGDNDIVSFDIGDNDIVSLKYYNADSSTWVSYIVVNSMLKSVYDPNNVMKDPYTAIADALSALVGDTLAKLYSHRDNTIIHLTDREREILDNIISKDTVTLIFSEDEELYNEILSSARNKISSSLDYSDSQLLIETASKDYDSHINNHITADMINEWDSKAASDHTHQKDGNIRVDTDHISGLFTSEQLASDVKEGAYQISSFGILQSASSVAGLLNSIYHNGNILYTEDSNGDMICKKIIDNTKFGTANYEEGLLDFSVTAVPSFESIQNTPTTLSGYSITDGVAAEATKVAEEVSHYLYTPTEYSVENVGDAEVYVGIQKTLSANGGGTGEYPMSTEHAELDVILAAANTAMRSGTSKLYKCNCEAEKCAYVEHWLEGKISDTSRNWRNVCYGNGKYIAIAQSSNMFAHSTDGITWTEGNISESNRNWQDVCYGNDKFVAIAADTNMFAYSEDGEHWEEVMVESNAEDYWISICYGNGKFIAISALDNDYVYSENGINWSNSVIYGDSGSELSWSWYDICYGNGKFVIVGSMGVAFYSTDGINWDSGLINKTAPLRIWKDVCYGNGKFIAISPAFFAYSTDAITWTEIDMNYPSVTWTDICYSNDKFIAIASNGNMFAYSIDGINWELNTIGIIDRVWRSICYGNGKCVIVASDTNAFAQLIDYAGMPQCKATGLSLIPADVPIEKYFSNTYEIDEENPNWETEGLGRMVKVDTSSDNTVINEKYVINNHEYDVKIKWDPNVGVVFDVGVVEAVETCQSMHDNMCAHVDGVQAAITLYDKIFTDNGWK